MCNEKVWRADGTCFDIPKEHFIFFSADSWAEALATAEKHFGENITRLFNLHGAHPIFYTCDSLCEGNCKIN